MTVITQGIDVNEFGSMHLILSKRGKIKQKRTSSFYDASWWHFSATL